MGELSEIGFYTLSDERVLALEPNAPLRRCELVLTSACNFACPYCRGMEPKNVGTILRAEAFEIVSQWGVWGLSAVRFSGGEPTLVPWLVDLVRHASACGIKHVAISTNGSARRGMYEDLLGAGANDFSVSLDGCCASTCSIMSGGGDWFGVVTANIRFLSERAYTTVGIVLTETNTQDVERIIAFASGLGVADIRIISAAQSNAHISGIHVDEAILSKHPILRYRCENIKRGQHVRGISPYDCSNCPLVLDDIAVLNGHHYPCVIYMREWGKPIGNLRGDIREERLAWFLAHDTHRDPICSRNCLDVCVDYNNRVRELRPELLHGYSHQR